MNKQIKSLSKGLNVYRYIVDYGKPILATTLCNDLNIEKSSMSRILKTLKDEGFIDYLENSKEIISKDILENTNKKTRIELLIKRTRQLLEDIFKLTNECTYLAIFDDYKLLYINQIDHSKREIRTRNFIGLQVPLHSNALGKSILAFGNYNLEKVKLNQYTNNTITNINDLKKQLEYIRNLSYAIDNKEYQDKMRCVAVPLFNKESILIGAVGISGSSKRLTLEKLNDYGRKISNLVLKTSIIY